MIFRSDNVSLRINPKLIMKRLFEKYVRWILWLAVTIAILLYMQLFHKFHFPFIEQQQLFLLDSEYLIDKLLQPAGVVTLVKEFMLSLFILPYCGAVSSTLLLVLAGILTQLIADKIDPTKRLSLVAGLWPVITHIFLLLNFDYQYSGIISYIIVAATFLWYLSVRKRDSTVCVIGSVMAALLYCVVGAAALWFAIVVGLYEICRSPHRILQNLIPSALVIVMGITAVYTFHYFGELRIALTADGYYNRVMHPEWDIELVWVGLPIVTVFASLLRKRNNRSLLCRVVATLSQLAIVAVTTWFMYERQAYYLQADTVRFQELDYLERTQQWDKIVESSEGNITNKLHLVILNTALIEQDKLAEHAFAYRQIGVDGISLDWSDNNPFIFNILGELHYALGNPSIAQELAFKKNSESIAVNHSNNSRSLMRLVETGLIYGNKSSYAVAEKYISILDRTLFYRDWAAKHRQMLYNDKAVEQDVRLGEERRNMKNIDISYALESNFDLVHSMQEGLLARRTIEHQCMGYLLNMDLQRFYEVVKRCCGTPLMPTLPKAFQEALLIHSVQNKSIEVANYGIPQERVKKFLDFQNFVARNYNRNDLAAIMRRSYGDTYWYYYMFFDDKK